MLSQLRLFAGPNSRVSEDIRKHPAVFQLFCKSSGDRSKDVKPRFHRAGLGAECQRDRALATLLDRRVFKSTDRPTRRLNWGKCRYIEVLRHGWPTIDTARRMQLSVYLMKDVPGFDRDMKLASVVIKVEGEDQLWPLFC